MGQRLQEPETGLRAGGCGLFYGLLAFHLTRVDPDDSHLQAGLVGAVCGIHSGPGRVANSKNIFHVSNEPFC